MKPKESEYSSHLAYTRALEEYCVGQAAVIEKLRDALNEAAACSGVLPLRAGNAIHKALAIPTDSKQILAEYRNAALEEAAEWCEEKVCDEVPCGLGGKEIAAAIREMAEP